MPWSPEDRVYAQHTDAQTTAPVRTTFQQVGGYAGEMDVQSDSVMAYISDLDSVDSTFDSWKSNNQSGRQIDVMIPAGRDTDEYFRLYPERGQKDALRWEDGSLCQHTPGSTVINMIPTVYYTTMGMDMGDGYWNMVIEGYRHETMKKITDQKYGSGASEYIARAFSYYL